MHLCWDHLGGVATPSIFRHAIPGTAPVLGGERGNRDGAQLCRLPRGHQAVGLDQYPYQGLPNGLPREYGLLTRAGSAARCRGGRAGRYRRHHHQIARRHVWRPLCQRVRQRTWQSSATNWDPFTSRNYPSCSIAPRTRARRQGAPLMAFRTRRWAGWPASSARSGEPDRFTPGASQGPPPGTDSTSIRE